MRRVFLVVTISLLLGIGAGEYLTNNFFVRRWIGRVVRRGDLQALVERRGIYDTDVERAWRAQLFANGADAKEIESAIAIQQKQAVLERLFEQTKLDAAAAGQSIESKSIAHEMELLRAQFGDEKSWQHALAGAGLSRRSLAHEVGTSLRDRDWLEAQIAEAIRPNETEIRQYYDQHLSDFLEPLRLRASHLFLAAPDGYPAELIATKRTLIEQLSKRLTNGESFPTLVAEFSEDEATKKREGDLGYFAERRMVPAVFAAARQLHPGETSPPVRSQLGFHIIRLTESRLPRQLTFQEAQREIVARLENQKRIAAVNGALP